MVNTTPISSGLRACDNTIALGLEMSTDVPSSSHAGSQVTSAKLVGSAPGNAVITCVPISRIAFPFNFSPPVSRRKPTCSPPASSSPHHKAFSRVPSPLGREVEPSTTPQGRPSIARVPAYRGHHRHHGYSRQALLHTKWFWSSREDEWHDQSSANAETCFSNSEASAILRTTLPNRSHCFRGTKPPAFEGDNDLPSTSPAVTAFPRRGDITALRDPYCVEADRCFAHVPIWTLAKVLWVHDMHTLSAPKVETPATDVEDDPFDEAASVASFDTTTSVGFSDDSESTLVDSETEWEAPFLKGLESPVSQGSSPSQSTEPLAWAKDVYLKPPRPSYNQPLNWYRRWEVLLELSNTKRRPEKSPPMVVKPLPAKVKVMVVPPPKPRMSFTRGFLNGLKKSANASASSSARVSRVSSSVSSSQSFVMEESFINPSHPAAG